ncbi:MAG TPA: Ni/Fe hydrogenase subunit alpha [Candidatus Acetothermia bacterium]|nr:Ni/Fe hydrogenase subunit alpha [Candidatus Acetothermia bacterium]
MKKLTIDPITRLEGHGKILLYLDEGGGLKGAVLQVPELRGFEAFCRGRRGEEMPQITERICGVCPEAHHLASARALDAAYGATVPPAAWIQRELFYNAYIFADHLLHLVFLGGPDLLLPAHTPNGARNVLGVLQAYPELGREVVAVRARAQRVLEIIGGRAIHPVFALPGGVSKPIAPDEATEIAGHTGAMVDLAGEFVTFFHEEVLPDPAFQSLLALPEGQLPTHYMGLVDGGTALHFCRGEVRAVSADGKELFRLDGEAALAKIAERVEPWTYVKFPYLREPGWTGFVAGPESGIYRVGPLARLNVAERMATPLAQEEYERFLDFFGEKPVHATFAYHWARLVEMVQAAEAAAALATEEDLTRTEIRGKLGKPGSGVGVVEAARGTLFHRYVLDEQGLVTDLDLIVATTHNAAGIGLSVKQMAEGVVRRGALDEALLNRIEMAFRAYDPCLACATHFLPGEMPLVVEIYDEEGNLERRITR